MMFTQDQGQELIDNTTSEWTYNKRYGRKFISKKDTSKYIFIPAAGYWYDQTHYNYNSASYYWSTKYYNSSSFRWYLNFASDIIQMTYRNPECGQSIRPVRPLEW